MEDKEQILNDAYITMWYHKDKGMVHHVWHKFLQGEEMRKAFMIGADAMKKGHGSKWLSDDRNYPAMTEDDAKWAQEVWFPAVKAAGWKYWAIVEPQKVIGQLDLKAFSEKYKALGIDVKIFPTPEEAIQWLDTKA